MTLTTKLSLAQLPLKGKKVLMRVDFNVPLDKQGAIADDSRIVASLPSISYVMEQGAPLILMSHLGRPKGKRNASMSLAPCARRLSELLGREVKLAPDCIGPEVESLVKNLQPGELLMLENLRFHAAEEEPSTDSNFVKALAGLGDVYVNDAFGAAHRPHASTALLANFFLGKAAAGFLMEKEIHFLSMLIDNHARPFYALIGGAKISSKMGVIKALLGKVDALLIGGAMAYTFLKAEGLSIGSSLWEPDYVSQSREILEEANKRNIKLLLPIDHLVAQEISQEAITKIEDAQTGISEGWYGVDIGPKTIALFSQEIKKAATLLWNGPLGIFEIPKFAQGTIAMAQSVANLSAQTVVGGGDSIAAMNAAGVANKVTHLSTGGGATLEYLEFGSLPGIETLTDSLP